MFSRPDGQHDLVIGQYGGNGEDSPGKRFSEDHDIRPQLFMIHTQHFTRAGDTRLDLVSNK
ncbi:hypothetical protein FQZ97_1084580 [compost metagenome]